MTAKEKFLKKLGLVAVIVLIATLIDWATHSTSSAFYVPFEYYRNKVIFGTVIGLISLWVFRSRQKIMIGTFLYAVAITVASAVIDVRFPLPDGAGAIALFLAVRFAILLAGISLLTYATIWIASRFSPAARMAALFSYAIALGLQTKYFFLGYDLFFVFLFLFLHFGMFLLPAVILFKRNPDLLN